MASHRSINTVVPSNHALRRLYTVPDSKGVPNITNRSWAQRRREKEQSHTDVPTSLSIFFRLAIIIGLDALCWLLRVRHLLEPTLQSSPHFPTCRASDVLLISGPFGRTERAVRIRSSLHIYKHQCALSSSNSTHCHCRRRQSSKWS